MTPAELFTWRADLGLTQQAAASALGVTLTTYQQMERGASYATGKPMAIDRRTALACASIRAGIAPEGAAS